MGRGGQQDLAVSAMVPAVTLMSHKDDDSSLPLWNLETTATTIAAGPKHTTLQVVSIVGAVELVQPETFLQESNDDEAFSLAPEIVSSSSSSASSQDHMMLMAANPIDVASTQSHMDEATPVPEETPEEPQWNVLQRLATARQAAFSNATDSLTVESKDEIPPSVTTMVEQPTLLSLTSSFSNPSQSARDTLTVADALPWKSLLQMLPNQMLFGLSTSVAVAASSSNASTFSSQVMTDLVSELILRTQSIMEEEDGTSWEEALVSWTAVLQTLMMDSPEAKTTTSPGLLEWRQDAEGSTTNHDLAPDQISTRDVVALIQTLRSQQEISPDPQDVDTRDSIPSSSDYGDSMTLSSGIVTTHSGYHAVAPPRASPSPLYQLEKALVRLLASWNPQPNETSSIVPSLDYHKVEAQDEMELHQVLSYDDSSPLKQKKRALESGRIRSTHCVESSDLHLGGSLDDSSPLPSKKTDKLKRMEQERHSSTISDEMMGFEQSYESPLSSEGPFQLGDNVTLLESDNEIQVLLQETNEQEVTGTKKKKMVSTIRPSPPRWFSKREAKQSEKSSRWFSPRGSKNVKSAGSFFVKRGPNNTSPSNDSASGKSSETASGAKSLKPQQERKNTRAVSGLLRRFQNPPTKSTFTEQSVEASAAHVLNHVVALQFVDRNSPTPEQMMTKAEPSGNMPSTTSFSGSVDHLMRLGSNTANDLLHQISRSKSVTEFMGHFASKPVVNEPLNDMDSRQGSSVSGSSTQKESSSQRTTSTCSDDSDGASLISLSRLSFATSFDDDVSSNALSLYSI